MRNKLLKLGYDILLFREAYIPKLQHTDGIVVGQGSISLLEKFATNGRLKQVTTLYSKKTVEKRFKAVLDGLKESYRTYQVLYDNLIYLTDEEFLQVKKDFLNDPEKIHRIVGDLKWHLLYTFLKCTKVSVEKESGIESKELSLLEHLIHTSYSFEDSLSLKNEYIQYLLNINDKDILESCLNKTFTKIQKPILKKILKLGNVKYDFVSDDIPELYVDLLLRCMLHFNEVANSLNLHVDMCYSGDPNHPFKINQIFSIVTDDTLRRSYYELFKNYYEGDIDVDNLLESLEESNVKSKEQFKKALHVYKLKNLWLDKKS